MGVPRLFKYIRENFPKAVIHFQKGEFTQTVDYLYIDANGLLHQAAQSVFNYGQMKRMIYPYKDLSEKEKVRKVYDLFFENIRTVTEIIVPRKVLYIAIDGPAPLSKQAQQRQRRFISAKNRSEDSTFDSNCITPGSTFMHRLTRYLHYAIRFEMNNYGHWKNLQVFFSPATVPSEGEHKLLDYIRELPVQEKEKCSHCLFGPDGDLIMLTLATHLPKMYLFREDQYNLGYYHFLDMGKIRRELVQKSKVLNRGKVRDITDDFIVEGFFVGNDFLPKIQMFYLLEDGIETMIDTYRKTFRKGFLTIHGKLSLVGFREFVRALEEYEKDLLEEQANARIFDPLLTDYTLLKHVTEVSGRKVLNFEEYRKSYYKKAISPNYKSDDINQMCSDYLKSFIWVLEYYLHGLPSWEWAYRWHYAPLLCDFSHYLQGLSQAEFKEIATFEMGTPSQPLVQLLSVLPPSSASILPKKYRKLMEKGSDLSQLGYYPEDFNIDYEGKVREYQGIALLPFISREDVRKAYNQIESRKYARNAVGSISLFMYDPEMNASFESDMGNIPNLKIRRKQLAPHRN